MTIRAEPEAFHPAQPTPAAPAPSLIARALKAFAVFWANQRNRRSVVTLLELDDRMLRDIGVTRYDVASALSTSPREDASSRLAEFSKERRLARHQMGSLDFRRSIASLR